MTTLRDGLPVPASPLPVLPLRTGAVFPGATLTFAVGRQRSVALVRQLHPGDVIVTLTQRDPRVVDVGLDDLFPFGTYARVKSVTRKGDREYELSLEGLGRARLSSLVSSEPFFTADVHHVPEIVEDGLEARELARSLVHELVELVRDAGGALAQVAEEDDEPGAVADRLAALLDLPTTHEIELLGEASASARLRLLVRRIGEGRAQAEVRSKIESEVKKELGKNQREHVLREQMRAIKRELGGDDDDELGGLKRRLDEAVLPEDVRKVVDRELRRLEGMNGQGAEVHVIRSYLELIADLPWSERAGGAIDLDAISAQLDADHYGLGDIKKRILEHVAVLKLSGNAKGTLLCFVGPPGVGKTSLGQSIADATGRPFVRVALGGVRDEAEIRGHRRTYVGALPGRLIAALRKAKVRNPVVLLDEIDKLGASWAGNPEAALLEVLDPEQNKTFTDHYLELPFDLSEVMFVCTANTLETLSAPLRDRLEIVELSGYTPDDKVHIAKRHLVGKRKAEHGIADGDLAITDGALAAIVRDYTREAGVRQLDREVRKICRATALEIAKRTEASTPAGDAAEGRAPADTTGAEATGPGPIVVDDGDLARLLGKVRFEREIAEQPSIAGVATGLAWTPFGGSILFIETSRMPGSGHVEITGQLGDVMKESARAALTYVRSNAHRLGIDPRVTQDQDVHIHVPAGSVPKDGPSAGVTIFTALASLFTGRRVRPDTAMTGEATLRGRVLPVGGIKAKVLAAHRAGIKRVILPSRCGKDLDDVPAEVRAELEVILVDDMSEALAAALEVDATDLPTPFGPRVAPGASAGAAAPPSRSPTAPADAAPRRPRRRVFPGAYAANVNRRLRRLVRRFTRSGRRAGAPRKGGSVARDRRAIAARS